MLDAKLYKKPSLGRRTSSRQRVGESTTLRVDGHAFDITVIDLSYQGFGAASNIDVPAGTPVRLGIPGIGAFNAKIAWSRDGLLGGYFDTPLTSNQIMNAFDSQVVVAGSFGQDLGFDGSPAENEASASLSMRFAIILTMSLALWIAAIYLVLLAL